MLGTSSIPSTHSRNACKPDRGIETISMVATQPQFFNVGTLVSPIEGLKLEWEELKG